MNESEAMTLAWRLPQPTAAETLVSLRVRILAADPDRSGQDLVVQLAPDRLWLYSDLAIPLWALDDVAMDSYRFETGQPRMYLDFFHFKFGYKDRVVLQCEPNEAVDVFLSRLNEMRFSSSNTAIRASTERLRAFLHERTQRNLKEEKAEKHDELAYLNELNAVISSSPLPPCGNFKEAVAQLQTFIHEYPFLQTLFPLRGKRDLAGYFRRVKLRVNLVWFLNHFANFVVILCFLLPVLVGVIAFSPFRSWFGGGYLWLTVALCLVASVLTFYGTSKFHSRIEDVILRLASDDGLPVTRPY